MRIAFVDDSTQRGRRHGMGDLLALGAVVFPESGLAPFAAGMTSLLAELGLPARTEIKWSPPRDSALRELSGPARTGLYARTLQLAAEAEARSVVVIWDCGRTSLQGDAAKEKVLQFLYERISMLLAKSDEVGIVVADKPGGGPRTESKWLAETLSLVEGGTPHVGPAQVVLPVLTASSDYLVHLQLADLVTGATTAAVASGNEFAIPLLPDLLALAHRNAAGYVGGAGLKLFPNTLLNLHHWVFGESSFVKVAANSGVALPWPHWPFYETDGLA